jgi:hypothetical protein
VDIKSRVGRAGSACSGEAGRKMMKGRDIKRGVLVELCVKTNDKLWSSLDCNVYPQQIVGLGV